MGQLHDGKKSGRSQQPSKLEWALYYAGRGFQVLPLHWVDSKRGGCSCGKAPGDCKPGKHPLTKHGKDDASSDPFVIEDWWHDKPQANVSVVLGGLLGAVVDVDNRHGGKESLSTLEAKYGPLPDTVRVLTGSGDGSTHFWFRVPDGAALSNLAKIDGLPGLELKVKGYVLAPPSVTTKTYTFAPGASLGAIPIADIPEWLIRLSQAPFDTSKAPETTGPEKKDYPPISAENAKKALPQALQSCAFLRHCADDAEILSEPEWAAMVELLVFFGPEGEAKIHELSRPYPRYLERGTDTKIKNAQKAIGKRIGPWTCTKIERDLGFSCPPECLAKISGTQTPVTMALKACHPERVPKFNLTDMGNAERLVAQFGDIIRFCPERKMWAVYDGKVWQWDLENIKIKALGKKVVRSIYSEAAATDDVDKRKAICSHAASSESDYRLSAMLRLAAIEPNISLSINGFDDRPWLFNCSNGTLDLRRGILQPHSKDDLLSIIVPIDYLPNATCPVFLKFIKKVMNDDPQLVQYAQRCVGYSLTGDVREQLFFFLWGRGNNGKTTFSNILRKVLGAYAGTIPIEVLLFKDKNTGGPREGLANLKGKRLAISSEVPEGRRLAETTVKDLAGNDSIKADRKYEHEIEFMPTAKLWLVGNHKPTVTDTSKGFWRKARLIPFTVEIPEGERDRRLPEKLEMELPGILQWAVEGCLAWQREGLGQAVAVAIATAEYQGEQDIVDPFIEECCTVDPNEDCTKGELYEAYQTWCKKSGEYQLSKRRLGERLSEKGFDTARGTHGVKLWVGISIKRAEEKQDSELAQEDEEPQDIKF